MRDKMILFIAGVCCLFFLTGCSKTDIYRSEGGNEIILYSDGTCSYKTSVMGSCNIDYETGMYTCNEDDFVIRDTLCTYEIDDDSLLISYKNGNDMTSVVYTMKEDNEVIISGQGDFSWANYYKVGSKAYDKYENELEERLKIFEENKEKSKYKFIETITPDTNMGTNTSFSQPVNECDSTVDVLLKELSKKYTIELYGNEFDQYYVKFIDEDQSSLIIALNSTYNPAGAGSAKVYNSDGTSISYHSKFPTRIDEVNYFLCGKEFN